MKINPADRNFYPQLDTLRCFSVLSVMIGHWWYLLNFSFAPPFGLGVYLFFILSGFLIGTILLDQKEVIDQDFSKSKTNNIISALKIFYARRALRIFPAYYAVIFLIFLIYPQDMDGHLSWLLTYTFNLRICEIDQWPGMLTPMWSLSIEEQFYILFPLLVFLIPRKWTFRFLVLMVAVGIFSKIIIWQLTHSTFDSSMFTTSCFDYLGLGAIIAYCKKYNRFLDIVMNKIRWLLILSIIFFCIFLYTYRISDSFYLNGIMLELSFSLFAAFSIVSCIYGVKGIAGKILDFKPFIYLGKISYGLYLFHMPVSVTIINTFEKHGYRPTLHPVIIILTHFLATILVASISYKFLEHPVNQLKKYFKYKNKIKPTT